jgi:hypothetical protein
MGIEIIKQIITNGGSVKEFKTSNKTTHWVCFKNGAYRITAKDYSEVMEKKF